MRRLLLLVTIVTALLAVSSGPSPPAAAASWRRPVGAPVAGRFAYSRTQPFAPGQRRGIDFAARAGEVVVAPCTGRVAYAGAVPGRGLGVTLRCGRLTATLLGLSAVVVRRGAVLRAGSGVGRASGHSVLRLGARETGRRFAYLDPLALLGAAARGPRPLLPVRGPRGGGRRRAPRAAPPLPAAPGPLVRPVPLVRPGPRPEAGPLRAPLLAWLGAGLLAAALGAGLALPAVRRRSRSAQARAVARGGVGGIEG